MFSDVFANNEGGSEFLLLAAMGHLQLSRSPLPHALLPSLPLCKNNAPLSEQHEVLFLQLSEPWDLAAPFASCP